MGGEVGGKAKFRTDTVVDGIVGGANVEGRRDGRVVIR